MECSNYCEMGTFHTMVAFGHEHFQTMNIMGSVCPSYCNGTLVILFRWLKESIYDLIWTQNATLIGWLFPQNLELLHNGAGSETPD